MEGESVNKPAAGEPNDARVRCLSRCSSVSPPVQSVSASCTGYRERPAKQRKQAASAKLLVAVGCLNQPCQPRTGSLAAPCVCPGMGSLCGFWTFGTSASPLQLTLVHIRLDSRQQRPQAERRPLFPRPVPLSLSRWPLLAEYIMTSSLFCPRPTPVRPTQHNTRLSFPQATSASFCPPHPRSGSLLSPSRSSSAASLRFYWLLDSLDCALLYIISRTPRFPALSWLFRLPPRLPFVVFGPRSIKAIARSLSPCALDSFTISHSSIFFSHRRRCSFLPPLPSASGGRSTSAR